MAAAHNLLSKNDRALVAFLVSKNAGTAADIFPSKSSGDKPLPVTICWSERAAEVAPYSGTYLIEVTVAIRTNAEIETGAAPQAARLASETRVAATFDAFHAGFDSSGENLGIAITQAAAAAAAADPTNNGDLAAYTALNCQIKSIEAGFIEEGANWEDRIILEVLAAPVAMDT